MKSFLFLILFISYFVNSQNPTTYRVLSENDSVAIKDAFVLIDEKVVAFSDSLGYFNINSISNTALSISHVNYKKNTISHVESNSVQYVFLQPKNQELEEILISNKKKKSKKILPTQSIISKLGYYKGHKTAFNSIYATYLPNKSKKEAIIKTILIQPHKGYWGDPNKQYMPFRVNIYAVDPKTNLPLNKLLPDKFLTAKERKNQKYVEVNIRDYMIEFPQEGIFVAIETLSEEEYQKLYSMSYEAPAFKIVDNKNSPFITYSRRFDEFGVLKSDWLDEFYSPLPFVFNFGVEIEFLN